MAKSLQINCQTGEQVLIDIPEVVPDNAELEIMLEIETKMNRKREEPSDEDFREAMYSLQKGDSSKMNKWVQEMDKIKEKYQSNKPKKEKS